MNNRNQRINPEIQEQMDYNAKISSRSFVQNNQKANLNTRDTNLMQMPNNNSFLNDRTFTEYNTRTLQTQNINQKQYENNNYSAFGSYSQFDFNDNPNNNAKTTHNKQNKPIKNVDLEYDIRMPVTLCKTLPGKLDGPSPGMFDKKGWRDYNNQKYLSSLQN